jgi:hypothetical protein
MHKARLYSRGAEIIFLYRVTSIPSGGEVNMEGKELLAWLCATTANTVRCFPEDRDLCLAGYIGKMDAKLTSP